MIRSSLAVAGLLFFCSASTQASAQADSSALCKLDATFNATLRSVENDEFFREVASKCKRGDVVAYPIRYTYVAKKTCDFSQQVIMTHDEIVCVYWGGQRRDR